MDVNARSSRALEWDRLKSFLGNEAACPASKRLCLSLEPAEDFEVARVLLSQTREAALVADRGSDLSQPGLPELEQSFARLAAGASLSAGELHQIRFLLNLSRRTKVVLKDLPPEDCQQLRLFIQELYSGQDLVDRISEILCEAGEVRTDASPALSRLYREKARLSAKIKEELNRIINSPTHSKYLQEALYTQRNGRYVLPVTAGSRASIQGIVHDSSSSGLTVFVEPMSVVEPTNKVRLCEVEIGEEIERLLSMLSLSCGKVINELVSTEKALAELDFIWARFRFAERTGGQAVTLSREPQLNLHNARHPLLLLGDRARSVVGNDIVFDPETRVLVITGPNTGGKTVYLKTAGLCALMSRSGLYPPCDPGSSIGFFREVFADIGDEQSLDQNLSTFSSHLVTIIEIVRRAGRSSLVLLDEIGAGTDPKEGTILARVILKRLKELGTITITSTHYSDLKVLAHGEAGFANAGMQFDETTLTPTFKMVSGVSASSRAFAVAGRLGLDPDLVEEARKQFEDSLTESEHKVAELEERMEKLKAQEDALAVKEKDIDRSSQLVAGERIALENERSKRASETMSELELEYQKARKTIATLTADLQKNPTSRRLQEAQTELMKLKEELGWDKIGEDKGKDQGKGKKDGGAVFAAGQKVVILSLNQKGTIESIVQDHCVVLVGRIKVKSLLSDLRPLGSEVEKAVAGTGRPRKPGPVKSSQMETSRLETFVRTADNTIDLRGMRADEALQEIESFVDSCYAVRLSPAMIIHGHGTGALKSICRDFLAGCNYKIKFRPGESYEGGDGVTVIQF